MATQRISAQVNKVAGQVQEAAGELLNDEGLEVAGKARQLDAALDGFCAQACDQLKSSACDLARTVERNPLAAVATAGILGFLLGRLLSRD